jgi:hypothetical protein
MGAGEKGVSKRKKIIIGNRPIGRQGWGNSVAQPKPKNVRAGTNHRPGRNFTHTGMGPGDQKKTAFFQNYGYGPHSVEKM